MINRRLDRIGEKVAETVVNDSVVSTAYLAIDHRNYPVDGDGPPYLWETAVLGGKLDGHRYESEKDAVVGHEAMVKRVSAADRTLELDL